MLAALAAALAAALDRQALALPAMLVFAFLVLLLVAMLSALRIGVRWGQPGRIAGGRPATIEMAVPTLRSEAIRVAMGAATTAQRIAASTEEGLHRARSTALDLRQAV